MLYSGKILKSIQSEIKNLESLLKLLSKREEDYKIDLSKEKNDILKSVNFYNEILEKFN